MMWIVTSACKLEGNCWYFIQKDRTTGKKTSGLIVLRKPLYTRPLWRNIAQSQESFHLLIKMIQIKAKPPTRKQFLVSTICRHIACRPTVCRYTFMHSFLVGADILRFDKRFICTFCAVILTFRK